jgi:hypothetical protein
VGFKRRREELELSKLEEEVKAMAQTRITALRGELEQLSDPQATKLDERTRLMLKDTFMNLFMPPPGKHLAQLTDGPSASNTPISISGVATALGYKLTTNESKRVGIDIRKRYQHLHGKPPPKHEQLCDGRLTLVNSYTEQERPLVTEALHAYFARGSEEDTS